MTSCLGCGLFTCTAYAMGRMMRHRRQQLPDSACELNAAVSADMFTGQMVVKLASVSWQSKRPEVTSYMSIGCSAVPEKSSEMYLDHHFETVLDMQNRGDVTASCCRGGAAAYWQAHLPQMNTRSKGSLGSHSALKGVRCLRPSPPTHIIRHLRSTSMCCYRGWCGVSTAFKDPRFTC
jgi:hypothetical protein